MTLFPTSGNASAARQWSTYFWSNLALLLMPAIATTVKSGYSYPAALLIIVGIVTFVRTKQRWTLPIDARWLYLSFLPLALCWLLDDWISGLGARSAEKPLRIMMTLPVLWYLARRPPSHIWLWLGASLGALIGCAEAAYQFFFLKNPRAGGAMFPIHFGDLVLLLGLICLCGWNLPQPKHRWVFRIWLLVSCFAGILASILSGTRGAWLGLGVIALTYMLYLLRHGHWKLLALLTASMVILTMASLAIPALQVESRVKEAVAQTQLFKTDNTANTSVGARLQMWKQAWRLSLQRPLLGWQRHGYLQQQRLGIERKQLDPSLADFDHPHNEILNATAKEGLVGLLALLVVYCVPFWLFARAFSSSHDPTLRAVSTAGMLVPLAYFGFGLTEAFLPHVSVTTFYFYFISMLWATVWGLQSRQIFSPRST